ncbi:unnamed protein product, partial [Dovyalis caffra]
FEGIFIARGRQDGEHGVGLLGKCLIDAGSQRHGKQCMEVCYDLALSLLFIVATEGPNRPGKACLPLSANATQGGLNDDNDGCGCE